jgi:CheY-like chemotaxis protein
MREPQSQAVGLESAITRLRSYASTLLGSKIRADRYIDVCLETIAEEPERVTIGRNSALELFKLFHVILDMLDQFDCDLAGEDDDQLHSRLQARNASFMPISRRLQMLVYEQHFQLTEAAKILGISDEVAGELLDRVQQELHCTAGARILVIEDEDLIADVITQTIEQMGHSVIGVAKSQGSAVQLAQREAPQLVLADVWLKGNKAGIRAVEKIRALSAVPVIYVTGYPDALLEETGINGAAVLTKPFTAAMLEKKIANMLPWQRAAQ